MSSENACKRYRLVVYFDLEEDSDELTPAEESNLRDWVQGTLDNGYYSNEVGFPEEKLSTGYLCYGDTAEVQ